MKNRRLLTGVLVSSLVASLCAVVTTPAPANAGRPRHRLVSATGLKQGAGHLVLVDVLVDVPEGADEAAATREALAKLHAQPLPAGQDVMPAFFLSGIRWPQFFDRGRGNDYVVQFYNPAGEPATGGDYQAALTAGQTPWTDVPTSSFAFQFGGTTTRCPSLMAGCDGAADGFNDAGWLPLEPNVAGQAFWALDPSGLILESDMVLNSEFEWFADPAAATATKFDAQSVMLHENGHVAGLGHSQEPEAVMFTSQPTGLGPRTLAADDIAAISTLYPQPQPQPQRPPVGEAGDLDPSFHTDGKVTTDFPESSERARAAAVQPDGKVVAAGESEGAFALARYNPDGTLDPTFGDDGVVGTVFSGSFASSADAVALQSDGKIVAVGLVDFTDFALARYNPDGSPDISFGTEGQVVTDFAGGFDQARAVALQPDGGIVVSGSTFSFSGGVFRADFALARYSPDGSLDTSFGTGGQVTTDFGGSSGANAVVVQPDGRIVSTGSATGLSGTDFALARYNTDGSLDTTFGTGGLVTTDFAGGSDGGSSVALQPDGKVVVAGSAFGAEGGNFALARYNTDGSLDTTFGTAGRVTTEFVGVFVGAADVVLQPDGKIVAAGQGGGGSSNFGLARYNPDGSLDTSFGTGGKVITDIGGIDNAFAVALQPDDKIVAVGHSGEDFALVGYNPDGSLDTSFGDAGKVTTDFNVDLFERANDVALQPDGKIVAAGVTFFGRNFGLARYNPDGSLDPSFGGFGKVTTDFTGGTDQAFAVTVQPDGKILAAGRAAGVGGTNFALARYHPDGSLDSDFSDDGKVTTDFAGGTDLVLDVAVQPDGKIVAAGQAFGAGSTNFALARYNPDGSLDPSFGTGGKVTTDFAGGTDAAAGLALQPDGSIVAAGRATSVGGTNFALARYSPTGSLDPAFGSGGKVTTDFAGGADQASDIVLQSDGRIVTAGDAFTGEGFDFALVRYNPDGSLDTDFSSDGKVTTDFGGDVDQAFAVALQPGGRIVAAGQTSTGFPFDFAVASYKPNGSLDTKFGNGGKVTTDFGDDDAAFGVAVQPDGKIVAAGIGVTDPLNGNDFAVARYFG